jgi:hypothetical protein
MMKQDEKNRDNIATAHKNFLKDAVYFLYGSNRTTDAAKWYEILSEKYPDKPILDGDPNSFPKNLTLEDYAVARVQEEIGDTSQERTTAVVQNLLTRAYVALAIGQDDRYAGYKLLAGKVYDHYRARTSGHGNEQRVGLPPFADLNRFVLNQMLDPQQGASYAARAVLRTQLGLPAETNAPPAAIISTNATATISSTNVPATNAVSQ